MEKWCPTCKRPIADPGPSEITKYAKFWRDNKCYYCDSTLEKYTVPASPSQTRPAPVASAPETAPAVRQRGWLAGVLGRGKPKSAQRIDHVFLFLESEELAQFLSRSIVVGGLLADLFPGVDLSDASVSLAGDPNLPGSRDLGGDLFRYKLATMFITRTRPDLMRALSKGHAGYQMRHFDFEIPVVGQQRGIVVSVASL